MRSVTSSTTLSEIGSCSMRAMSQTQRAASALKASSFFSSSVRRNWRTKNGLPCVFAVTIAASGAASAGEIRNVSAISGPTLSRSSAASAMCLHGACARASAAINDCSG